MVQDFTTSLDQFETFALSEMAKQPGKYDPLSPFSPKSWGNKSSTSSIGKSESLTSIFETSIEDDFKDFFSTPRRSGRLANQKKINYNENYIPKKCRRSQRSRQKRPIINRNKAIIRRLFKKPSERETAKTKSKSKTKKTSKNKRGILNNMANKFCISIPLIHTSLLTTSVTKASLKLFEDVLTIKPEHSHFAIMNLSDGKNILVKKENVLGNTTICRIQNDVDIFDVSNKYIQPENKNFIEAFKETEQLSNSKTVQPSIENKLPTKSLFGNVFGQNFSGIFKSFKNYDGIASTDSSKENEKLKQNLTAKPFEGNKIEEIQLSDTNFPKFNRNNGFVNTAPKKNKNLEHNLVNETFIEEKEQCRNEFMEVPDETQPFNLEAESEGLGDYQMMEISSESRQYLEEKPPKDAEHFREDNDFFKNSHEQSIIEIPSEDKEQPLDLTIMDISDETCKPSKIEIRSRSIITEENREFSEDLSIMEVSNEIPSSNKINSINAEKCSSRNDFIFDSLKKANKPDHRNFTIAEPVCVEESDKIHTFSMSNGKNDKQSTHATQISEECALLSDNLSVLKISEINQKPGNMNINTFEEKGNELQNPTTIDTNQNAETSNDNDDVFILENEPLENNNIKEIFEKYKPQSSSSIVMEILDENENDHQADERAINEKKIIEELKSLIEECPLDGNDYENTAETVVNEVEIYEESNEESKDSEIEVIEEPFSNNTDNSDDNENEETFNKNSDDVEMIFPQRSYQQEYIEVIHQYNYFPFPNYQYPRYEYPIEENKFNNYRPTNLSFLSQRYGEFQIPQVHLDYNNYVMQLHAPSNFEQENKLEITEYDSEEEEEENEKEKDKSQLNTDQNDLQNKMLQVQTGSHSYQNEFPILSQPPPIQCSSEQQQDVNAQRTEFYFHPQSQIGQICENSSQLQAYSQDNLELTNNQWQIISTPNSCQTSSEQRDSQLYENVNTIQVLPHDNEENQSESQMVQRFYQDPSHNIQFQQLQSQITPRQHQGMPQINLEQEDQPLSQIAQFVKNNCHIHDVKFGKLKTLNGRLYRTGSLLITFGDHYKVQVIGDLIVNNINENIAFDTFFSPRKQF